MLRLFLSSEKPCSSPSLCLHSLPPMASSAKAIAGLPKRLRLPPDDPLLRSCPHHLSASAITKRGRVDAAYGNDLRLQTIAKLQSVSTDSKTRVANGRGTKSAQRDERPLKSAEELFVDAAVGMPESYDGHEQLRHPPPRIGPRPKTAEELFLDAVAALPQSCAEDYSEAFDDTIASASNAEPIRETPPEQDIRLEAEKACESDCAEVMHVDAVQGIQTSRNAISSDPHQIELTEDMGRKTETDAPVGEENIVTAEANVIVSQEQKIRMESNKAAALAKRNLRICEETVAEAQAKGLPFPKWESLMVEKTWLEALQGEFQKPYMENLYQFVSQEAAGRIPIYPPPPKLFNAFNSCPLDKVKVVIIGQDPYHGPGQAMGLSFSVEKGIKVPSSLLNIFREIQSDLGCSVPSHGDLEKWAHQGVLLLNTVLTVREGHANSHAKKGWELFTDAAIRVIAQQRSDVVFLLWGNSAQEKTRLLTKTTHHVFKAPHPSGISAHRGFFNCRHFSMTNKVLEDQGLLPIDWQL